MGKLEPSNDPAEQRPERQMMQAEQRPEQQKADVVYLHTFPASPHVYNISPFAIKVESFLRLHKIETSVVHTTKFGSKGQIPYVILNGREIPDSNVIIPALKEHFKIDIDQKLTTQQRAVGHAVMRMLEEHTSQIGFFYRYGLHMPQFYKALSIPQTLFDSHNSLKGRIVSAMWLYFQPKGTQKALKARKLARHSHEELWTFCNEDLQAISDLLGEQDYLFGEEPSTVDCVLFGHLAQFVYIPIDFPQKEYMETKCCNLIQFVERFKNEVYPDWEDKCPTVNAEQAGERALNWCSYKTVATVLGLTAAIVGFSLAKKR